jgi:(p)ppGpp synthase/HD superfamily hydrolase
MVWERKRKEMEPIVARAAALASVAHAGQFRRGGVVPYFSHPEAVAAIVARFLPDDADAIAAAYLHDVVEDCGVAPEEIAREFGPDIAAGVLALSKVPGLPVEGYRAGLAAAPGWVASVKCADIIHNAGDVAEVDPAFARRWLPGKIADLEVLGHADPAIYAEACAVVARALAVASHAA